MLLVLAAVVIWGSMFVVTKYVLHLPDVDPIVFLALRFLVATFCFLPWLRRQPTGHEPSAWKSLTPAAMSALFLSSAYLFQTYGIKATTVPNAAFLSSTYVLFAPLLTIIVLRRRVGTGEALGAIASILGAACLTGLSATITPAASGLLLACSLLYACQITSVAARDTSIPAARFSGQQMAIVAGIMTVVLIVSKAFTNEPLHLGGMADPRVIAGVFYAGGVGSALAFWLQTAGQNRISATQTAILFAMEPVFAIALEKLLPQSGVTQSADSATWLGGFLIILGVMVSNLPKANSRETASSPRPVANGEHAPPDPGTVKTLILKGGGVKGLALAGAAAELMKAGYNFSTYVGTSAGAIGSTLLAAGYSPRDLKDELTEVDLSSFMDAGPITRIVNLITRGGLYPARRLSSWIEACLRKQFPDEAATPNITLRTILEKKERRVIVFASHPKLGAIPFDSDGENSDTTASHAVRLSATIPGFFVPERFNGHRVYDGGLLHNFPIEIYQRIARPVEDDFIALYTGHSFEGKPSARPWFAEALDIMLARDDTTNLRDHRGRCVVIDTRPIETTDFALELEEKTFLYEVGRLAALEFLGAPEAELRPLRIRVADLRSRAAKTTEIRKRYGRLRLIAAAFFAIGSFAAAAIAVRHLEDLSDFSQASGIRFSNSHVDSSGRTTPLSCSARSQIWDLLRNYPPQMERDHFKFDSIVQVSLTGASTAAKLFVGEGTYDPASSESFVRFSASKSRQEVPLSEMKLFTSDAGLWSPAPRCNAAIREQPSPATGKTDFVFDLSNCLYKQTRVRVVGFADYGTIWRSEVPSQPGHNVEPWILFAHRLLAPKGRALYLMMLEDEGQIRYPRRVYVKVDEESLAEIRMPRSSRESPALSYLLRERLEGVEQTSAVFDPVLRVPMRHLFESWNALAASSREIGNPHFLFSLSARQVQALGEAQPDENIVVFVENHNIETLDGCSREPTASPSEPAIELQASAP